MFHKVDFKSINRNPNAKIELNHASINYYNYYNLPHKKYGVIYVK